MLHAVTWLVLHAGPDNDGVVSFDVALSVLVGLLVVVGVLWYLGAFEDLGPTPNGDVEGEPAEPDSGAGD